VDVDWGSDATDRKSYTGFTFILGGAAISWESRKQRTVALSSTETEYMAITDATKEAIYLMSFLNELGLNSRAKVTIWNDNQGAAKLAHNTVHHSRTKHIDIRHHFVREVLKNHPIRLEYLPSEEMIADVLTKGLPKSKHEKCTFGLGLISLRHINTDCV